MKRSIIAILLLTLTSNAQTLKDSVQEVLETNPGVIERQKNYNALREDITIARAGYLPKVDLSLGAGLEDRNNYPDGLPDIENSGDVYSASIKVTQNIFKGFETSNQVDEQKARTLAAAYSYIETANDTSLQTVKTYIELLRNKELLGTAGENVKINKDIFEKVRKLYDSGLTTLSEVNKIESSLALARSNYVVQENNYANAQYTFARIIGRTLDPETLKRPQFDIQMPKTRDEASEVALDNNPSLIVSIYNLRLAQSTWKSSRANYYPRIDLEVSQDYNQNTNAIDGDDNNFKAMAYLTYNIFNGFADKAEVQKNVSRVHQEVQTRQDLKRQVTEGLNLSWESYIRLQDQLVHLKDYKKYSKKTLTLYAKEYDLGRRSLLDLLSSQNDFIGSKSQIITTEYNLLVAKYRILDAMGTMVTSILSGSEYIYANVGLDSREHLSDVIPEDQNPSKL